MDKPTITALIEEATKKHEKAKKRFLKHDNHEDMHEMEAWEHAISWLQEKLK